MESIHLEGRERRPCGKEGRSQNPVFSGTDQVGASLQLTFSQPTFLGKFHLADTMVSSEGAVRTQAVKIEVRTSRTDHLDSRSFLPYRAPSPNLGLYFNGKSSVWHLSLAWGNCQLSSLARGQSPSVAPPSQISTQPILFQGTWKYMSTKTHMFTGPGVFGLPSAVQASLVFLFVCFALSFFFPSRYIYIYDRPEHSSNEIDYLP